MRCFIVLWLLIGTSHASAQDLTLEKLKEISTGYNNCVYVSAASQFGAVNKDINLAAERAFDSCKVEGEQLVQVMRLSGLSENQIQAGFLNKKRVSKKNCEKC